MSDPGPYLLEISARTKRDFHPDRPLPVSRTAYETLLDPFAGGYDFITRPRPRMFMDGEERKVKFLDAHVRRAWSQGSWLGAPVVDLDVIEADALVAWDRLQAERDEHLEVVKYYQQIAKDDLRKLKKRLGNRTRMTITVPERIHQRLSHVPTGLRSACVTRLLARGWLWSEAYGSEEVG